MTATSPNTHGETPSQFLRRISGGAVAGDEQAEEADDGRRSRMRKEILDFDARKLRPSKAYTTEPPIVTSPRAAPPQPDDGDKKRSEILSQIKTFNKTNLQRVDPDATKLAAAAAVQGGGGGNHDKVGGTKKTAGMPPTMIPPVTKGAAAGGNNNNKTQDDVKENKI